MNTIQNSQIIKLIESICRCQNIGKVLNDQQKGNPCEKIILGQENQYKNFQVPEPFSGKINISKIVFLTCNPSISKNEDFPSPKDSNETYYDFFYNRYDSNHNLRPGRFIEGKKVYYNNGIVKVNKTLAEIKSVADHVLGSNSIPGIDYANIEIIHCKSKSKKSLTKESINECVNLHFGNVLKLVKAKVIISCGIDSLKALNDKFNINAKMHEFIGPVKIFNETRHIAFIGQPGSSETRKGSNAINNENLKKIRELIL